MTPIVTTCHMTPADVRSVMLCGIEAHVCVQQTAMDLIERGFDVHLIADAVSSRNNTDRFVRKGLAGWTMYLINIL